MSLAIVWVSSRKEMKEKRWVNQQAESGARDANKLAADILTLGWLSQESNGTGS